MRFRLPFFAVAVLLSSLFAVPLPAQDTQGKPSGDTQHWYSPARYNPMKYIHLGPKSANEQLAADGHLEDKLTKQLRAQGLLPATTELQEFCGKFRDLATCVAAMHVSHTLKIDFQCLKWDVTGIKPKGVPDACAGPAGGKAMRFERAIDLLKPDSNAHAEANTAMHQANNDIRNANAKS
jgi:hypothetical protein